MRNAGDTADTVDIGGQHYFRILGRTSVDIIKSAGHKISALHVENALLEHEAIEQAAVLGVPDDLYGQVVACLVVSSTGAAIDAPGLRAWARSRLPAYEVPKLIRFVDDVPKNAMGKVNKLSLQKLYFDTESRM
jgi:malonyl-CoA/methylmalonyl-CoA synthetase